MRHALRKILVLALSVGLAVGAPALSHTRAFSSSSIAASHEAHDVQHYADLSVEPGDDPCLHAAGGAMHDQDDGLCKKCCAACLGASLIPDPPVAERILIETNARALQGNSMLVAHVIPTEPGIPKGL
jgi:hypothetical protein